MAAPALLQTARGHGAGAEDELSNRLTALTCWHPARAPLTHNHPSQPGQEACVRKLEKYYCGLLLGSSLVHFSSHIMAAKYTNIDPARPKELFSLNLEGHPV